MNSEDPSSSTGRAPEPGRRLWQFLRRLPRPPGTAWRGLLSTVKSSASPRTTHPRHFTHPECQAVEISAHGRRLMVPAFAGLAHLPGLDRPGQSRGVLPLLFPGLGARPLPDGHIRPDDSKRDFHLSQAWLFQLPPQRLSGRPIQDPTQLRHAPRRQNAPFSPCTGEPQSSTAVPLLPVPPRAPCRDRQRRRTPPNFLAAHGVRLSDVRCSAWLRILDEHLADNGPHFTAQVA